jgi:hypothetical protein
MMTEDGSSDVIIPEEAEEVFALHFAETLLGSEALATLLPSPGTQDRFSLYWRSSPVDSADDDAHGGTALSLEGVANSTRRCCLYVDITMHFQKEEPYQESPAPPPIAINIQFGGFWREQKSSAPPETRHLYTVLRDDPTGPPAPHWFLTLRHHHFQQGGIDGAATPGPVLARLWGRAWREWTPDQATWDEGPGLYLRYPRELARSRVPFPLYHERRLPSTDPSRMQVRLDCETVPVQMAQSILLQHRQQSLVGWPESDASTSVHTLDEPLDEPKQKSSCWELYKQWKSSPTVNFVGTVHPPTAATAIDSAEVTPKSDTNAAEPAPPPSATDTTAAAGPVAKRRRIVRPNAPRRAPMSSSVPPGQRFV